jgi:GrpB-like predicted nucleotidyltransferase (UPF0157 family)
MIGEPEPVRIVIVEHDPAWHARFSSERERIRSALGPAAIRVEHVGSTSVPGLAAKPIVDILLVVDDSSDEAAYLPALEEVGYELRVREPDWHEHRMVRTRTRDVHVHVFSAGSSEIDRHLAFRDWLRGHPEDCEMYAATKRTLAGRDWPTMQDYADAKTAVIEEIMGRAAAPSST